MYSKIIYYMSILITCLALIPISLYTKNKKTTLIGTHAPQFSLPDQTGTVQSLNTFLGKKVALCFYPKDKSSLCTQQLCSLRDDWSSLDKENIVIIGINSDSIKKHTQFSKQHSFPFLLLSDPDKKVACQYHATYHWYSPLSWLGFVKRVTILIDEKGYIVDRITDVDITHPALQIKNAFDAITRKK